MVGHHHMVEGSSVRSSSLHITTPVWRHVYALPFLAAWGVYGAAWMNYNDVVHEDVWLLLALVAALVHALTWLACFWSVHVRTMVTCLQVSDPFKAELIKVVPVEHRGRAELCPLQRSTDTKDKQGKPGLWFVFQRRKYLFDPEKKTFRRLDYPTHGDVTFYQNAIGFTQQSHIEAATLKYGLNHFDIPLPTFMELYKEHAVAPFFVFQVFCVGLWCLDEYWYFSIFTLFMLLTFESTVVFQRQSSMKELRRMKPKPYPIQVYRCGSWITVQTDALLPGDLCSIVRSQDDRAVPADMLMLTGTCIVNEAMLTGESTPQIKEPISERQGMESIDILNRDKLHVVFSGTKVIQSTSLSPTTSSEKQIICPDGGALAFVLRTGFDTSQGKLVRTILFSNERVTANNIESLFFILFLMIFAVAASSYVWVKGMESGRTRWKVVLDCILIITSVIPPELPMELALAVNQSIIALTQRAIFCTEPFRIPFAGKVDICCFDKTGTLTTEEIIVEGIGGLGGEGTELTKSKEAPETSAYVIATCHSLMQTESGLIGDPMEGAALCAVDWVFSKDNVASACTSRAKTFRLIRRFPFSSALKRMATVSSMEGRDNDSRLFVAVKGAPETLATMLIDAPASYNKVHKQFAMQGARVLALGYKYIPGASTKAVKEMVRDSLECDLHFAGFLVLSCPLKPDSKDSLLMLSQSSHRVLMITGDNALTACHVAREVHIVDRPVLIMDVKPGLGHQPHALNDLQWSTIDDSMQRPIETEAKALIKTCWDHDICMTGQALSVLAHRANHIHLNVGQLLAHVRVFARTSPQEKELIVTSLKKSGYVTLMCGDGTNDVGALKQADVGVALLDGKPEDLPKILHQMRTQALERRRKATEEAQRMQNELLRQRQQGRGANAAIRDPQSVTEATQRRKELLDLTKKLMTEMEENEVPLVKLGDASIAAPFTSKISHVTSICDIIRQGRSTLVTTIQMYKILALNCLVTAYSLSVLYLDGIKYGDTQMTIQGILLAVCFLGLSNAKPLKELSKKRPQPNIFNTYLLVSVIGQFAIHIYSLISVTYMAKSFMEQVEKVDLEKKFEPSLLNGAVYLLSLSMQVSTFVINYQGRPFRENLFENKPLFYALSIVMTICVVAASDLSSDMRSWLNLVEFPEEYRNQLLKWIGIDFFGAMLIEFVANRLFADNRPHHSLRL